MSKKEFSYRKATEEIEGILEKIENGQTDIDELAEEIQHAARLLQTCKDKLHQTELEVEKIIRQTELKDER